MGGRAGLVCNTNGNPAEVKSGSAKRAAATTHPPLYHLPVWGTDLLQTGYGKSGIVKIAELAAAKVRA